ncbi:right-handed parallel beta-helix repeat-containing protein, partial [Candidatus Woesearchaeota archaeon]|nr:right-handed parallel beta-helix repeat-containing protein [Candidatus Woesearchaeota archaeon]
MGALIGIILASAILFNLISNQFSSSITGYAIVEKSFPYRDILNLNFEDFTGNSSYLVPWNPSHQGSLKEIRFEGTINGEGSGSIALNSKGGKFLLTSWESRSTAKELSLLSKARISINPERPINAGANTAISQSINQQGLNISADDPLAENLTDYNLSEPFPSNILSATLIGGGSNSTEGIIPFALSDIHVDEEAESHLCSVWSVEGEAVQCNGYSACCAFFNLDAEEQWDEPFYLTYGRYGEGLEKNVSYQAVFFDLNTSIPRADIFSSEKAYFEAKFFHQERPLDGNCRESCPFSLPIVGLDGGVLTFDIKLLNSSLFIESVRYVISQSEEVPFTPPRLVKPFDNVVMVENEVKTIDLSQHFQSEKNLTFTVYTPDGGDELGDAAFLINGSIATIIPRENFTGSISTFFIANDSVLSSVSNVVTILVQDEASVMASAEPMILQESTRKPTVRLNEPVKWVREVNASFAAVNLSIPLPEGAMNVTVINSGTGKEVYGQLVKIKDDGVIKDLSLYNLEGNLRQIEAEERTLINAKREQTLREPNDIASIESINKALLVLENEKNDITGYISAARASGNGMLARFFEWLVSAQITGLFIQDNRVDSGGNIGGDGGNIGGDGGNIGGDGGNIGGDGNKIANEAHLIIEEPAKSLIIEYFTEAPTSKETLLSENSKRVVISSGTHYEDILASASLPVEAVKEKIRLVWRGNESSREAPFEAFDDDNDGLIDYIEWIVPSLSNQTYDIILVTKAEHLDSNRTFIENVYEQVREKDDAWSPPIFSGDFVRATFEIPLTSKNDITVFARASPGGASIEVFENGKNESLALFPPILSEGTYRIRLTGLNGSQEAFDLKILGDGASFVTFDHIIDPSAPSVTSPVFNNTSPFDNQDISANSTYTDPDGDVGRVNFTWYVNNIPVYNQTFLNVPNGTILISNISSLNFTGGDSVNVSVAANDSSFTGAIAWSNTSNIQYGNATDTCLTLNNPNAKYVLIQNLTSSGTCFAINANNITIDCRGHFINYSTSAGFGISVGPNGAVGNITVQSCILFPGNLSASSQYGIVYANTLEGLIKNNTVMTRGVNANNGIFLSESHNIAVESNNVSASGSGNYNYGIYLLKSNGSKVVNNTIVTNGTDHNYGFFAWSGMSLLLSNNNITTNGSSNRNYGIYIDNQSFNNVSRNNVVTHGTDSNFGILLYNTSNNIFEANNISSNGTSSWNYGVLFDLWANNNSFFNNTVHADGAGSRNYGIYLYRADYNAINNNTLTAKGVDLNFGILVYNASFTEIHSNYISSFGTSFRNFGILLDIDSKSSNVSGNVIIANGTSSDNYGIFLILTANNTVVSNNITTNGTGENYGIILRDTSFNNISKNNISTSGNDRNMGIYFDALSQNNTIAQNAISTIGANSDALYFNISGANSPDNNNFTNNSFLNVAGLDLSFGEGSINGSLFKDALIRNYSLGSSGGLMTVESTTFGKVQFFTPINGSGTNFSKDILFGDNGLSVNTSVNPGLNRTANISLNLISLLGFLRPRIYRDNAQCNSSTTPVCFNFTSLNASVVTFNVSSFTNYSIADSNSAPSLTVPAFNNTSPRTDDDLRTNTTYTDSDNDAGTLTFAWKINNTIRLTENYSSIASGTTVFSNLSSALFGLNDRINVTVNATDGYVGSGPVNSTNITVADTSPNVTAPSVNNTAPKTNEDLRTNTTYTDPDG